jgi:hypothetical protein
MIKKKRLNNGGELCMRRKTVKTFAKKLFEIKGV